MNDTYSCWLHFQPKENFETLGTLAEAAVIKKAIEKRFKVSEAYTLLAWLGGRTLSFSF